jgi:hypothetical protein
MSSNKDQQFTERLSTAASARRAMLEKFQARRTVDDPAARERRAAQEALRAARETRMAEREAARRAKQERLSAERLARKAAESEQLRAQEAREAAERAEREAALEGSEELRVRPCIGPSSAETRRDEPPFAR